MLTLHYNRDGYSASHPFKACIVSASFIGPEVSFRDENQMRCYALGFLNAHERGAPMKQSQIELLEVENLPTCWDRSKVAYA